MRIKADTVVAIDYTLKDDAGDVVDTSDGSSPLYYLHGHGNIVKGLEDALTGLEVGETLEVSVPPEDGYGPRLSQLVLEVPKHLLQSDVKPHKGMMLELKGPNGAPMQATVTKVKLDSIELDANHPLADKTLHFAVAVREVRRASKDELEHGHAHAPGHHH